MIAETCGIPAMPANVAPPLKSTSTKLRISGEWVIARPRTRVRRSSDLPDPVAPMTRPCGPMPCCADSLMSRLIELPSAPTPIGTRSRSRGGRGRQERPRSRWWTSPIPSRSVSSVLLAEGVLADRTLTRIQGSEASGGGLGRRDGHLVGEAADRLLPRDDGGDADAALVARVVGGLEVQPDPACRR